MRTAPTLVLASLALALGAGSADARIVPREFRGHERQVLPVVVVHGLRLDALPRLAKHGAVGLLVPSAGPETSGPLAFAGLVRGVLHNARLGPRPQGPVLIRVEKARTLAAVPEGRVAIVVGLPAGPPRRNDRRYPVAVLGPCRGILVSSLTRVPGLVSAADVARTALQSPHALRCERDPAAATTLERLERRVEAARATTMPGTVIVLAAAILLALLLPAAAPPALVSALGANLALGFLPVGGAGARLALLAAATLAGGAAGRRLFRRPAAGAALLLGTVAAYGVAMGAWPWALSLAPLGPELTSRFYGVSNLVETLLLVPALAGTALLRRRHGWWAFAAAATLCLVTISENRLGADGGGALVLAAGFAVLAVLLRGGGIRTAALALAAAGAGTLALLTLDAALAGPDHLSGALRGGLGGIASVAAHRVPLAYARVAEQWYLVFPLGALTALLLRSRRRERSRERRAVLAAFGTAMLASLLVNDSPGPVTLAGLAALLALEPGAVRHELAAARRLSGRPLAPAPAAVPLEGRVLARPSHDS